MEQNDKDNSGGQVIQISSMDDEFDWEMNELCYPDMTQSGVVRRNVVFPSGNAAGSSTFANFEETRADYQYDGIRVGQDAINACKCIAIVFLICLCIIIFAIFYFGGLISTTISTTTDKFISAATSTSDKWLERIYPK